MNFSTFPGFVGIGNKGLMQALVHELVDRAKEVQLFEERQFSDTVRTLLFDAAEFGNAEFLIILIRSYPNFIWTKDKYNRSLFHTAVINRQESVFNLIYEIVAVKEIILTYVDDSNENILHLAGRPAPTNRLDIVSGAALQMQRELLWLKVGVCINSMNIIVSHLFMLCTYNVYNFIGDVNTFYWFTFKHEIGNTL